MRILMLSDVYFPRINGVSSSIRTFARDLAGRGHAVTVVAPAYGGDEAATDAAEAFEIVRVPARRIFFDPEDRLMRAGPLRDAARALSARGFDVVHVHTPFRAHAAGVRIARALGCGVVESYHTYFEEYVAHYLPWLPAPLLRLAARRLSRAICAGADHLIVPSAQMLEVLGRYGIRTPATVIPTGLALPEFDGGDGARFRARHGIAPGRPVLVTVSRLAREKNIGFLLEVAARVRERHPDVLLLVAGEGPDGARLRARASALGLDGNVRFFGNLDRATTLLDCYRAGDVFVFASPTETQGLVLIEAMALGIPIVSTAVMGTAAVLAGARSARIAPPDVYCFAAEVEALLASPESRAALAAHGRDDARAWSSEALMQRVVSLYESLAARDGTAQAA